MNPAVRWGALAAVLPLALVTGCASVTSGTSQPVAITTVCEGRIVHDVACVLVNDKGRWDLKTPGTAVIQKSYGDLSITCRAGASSGTASFVSKSNGGAWGNLLLGGLIGYAVDSSSGAGFEYPTQVPVVMQPPCPAIELPKETKEKP
jgi:hypothetical protein